MTESNLNEEKMVAIERIVEILESIPNEDIRYFLTAAETLATRALINQEQQSA